MTNEFSPSPDLSPDDQRVLDALVDAGFSTEGLEAPTPADRNRAAAAASLFELLEDYPVEDADDTLIHATLARIDRIEDGRAARMSFDNEAGETGPRRRVRLPDFISVAAVILIGASVVWPITAHLREQSIDDLNEPIRDFWIDLLNRARCILTNAVDHCHGALRAKRGSPRAHRVQHAAQAKQIRAVVDRLATRLFR